MGGGNHDWLNASIVEQGMSSTWGSNPTLEREQVRVQPAVPDAAHNRMLKYHANGFEPRKRLTRPPVLGGSGYRLPQPPLGATMGHGLHLGDADEHFEFYYPPRTEDVSWSKWTKANAVEKIDAYARGARRRPVYNHRAIDYTLNMKTQREQSGGRIVAQSDILRKMLGSQKPTATMLTTTAPAAMNFSTHE
jgi:hypothetical protein